MLFLQSFVSHTDTSHMSFNKNQRRANAFPPELRLTHRTRPTWALTRIREEPMLFLQSFVSAHRTRPTWALNKNKEEPMLFLQSFVSQPDTSHMSFNKNERRANAFPPELRLTHRTRPTWALTRIREEPMLFLQSFVSHTPDTSHMSFNTNQRRANAFPPELRLSHTQDTSHMSFNKNQRRANAFPPELRLAHRTRPTWALTRIREEPMLSSRASSRTPGHVPHEL